MLKESLIVFLISSLLLNSIVLAQELPSPGMLPDNPIYPLKTFVEKVRLWFTFDPDARARFHTFLAEQRLVELNATITQNKLQFAQQLRTAYENEINDAETEMNRTAALGRNITALAEHVSERTYKHILVLERVLEKAPEQAKPVIEKVINASIEKHEIAVNRILLRVNKTLEKIESRNCTADVECRRLICPMVIGRDTPVCEDGKCKCGAKWQIINKTEWRERYGEELTNKTQEIQEKIKERTGEKIISKIRKGS